MADLNRSAKKKMKTRILLNLSLIVSIIGLGFFITGIPFMWQAVTHRWKPSIDVGVIDLVEVAVLLLVPLYTILFLWQHPEERKKKIGVWTARFAIASLSCLGLSLTAGLVLHYLPARETTDHINLIFTKEKTPNQASEPTAAAGRGSS